MLDHPVEQLDMHLLLRLHLRAADDGAEARHEARVLSPSASTRASESRRPPSQPPPNQSNSGSRCGETTPDRNDVRVREEHVNVAVGVRFEQIAVLDALLPDRDRAFGVKRLRGPAGRRQRRLVAVFIAASSNPCSVAAASSRAQRSSRRPRPSGSLPPTCSGCQCVLNSGATPSAREPVERSECTRAAATRRAPPSTTHFARVRREREDVTARAASSSVSPGATLVVGERVGRTTRSARAPPSTDGCRSPRGKAAQH